MSRDYSLHKLTQGLPHFNQKWLEKCSNEKHQLNEPKLVETQPK